MIFMSTESTHGYTEILKLTKEQLSELLLVFEKAWANLEIVMSQTESGVGVFSHGSLLKKYTIAGIDQKTLPSRLSLLVDVVNDLLHSVKNKKTIKEDLGVSTDDADKLENIWNAFEKSKILYEIDYRFHTSIPRMDARTLSYDIRLLSPIHFDGEFFPTCTISFKVEDGASNNPVIFEMTKNELKKLITDLQSMEKAMEKTEEQIKLVKRNE